MLVLENLKTNVFPASALYEQEVNLLVAVANRFTEKYPSSARKELRGSFKLIGRHRGDKAKEILSFDFPGGINIGHNERASFEIVDHLIGQADPAIYESKNATTNTLIIETKYGSFIMAVAMAPRDLSYSFLLQMACAIKQLGYSPIGSSDRTLAFSIDSLYASRNDRDEMFRLETELMGNYFSTDKMKEWLRWHRNHYRSKGSDELGFFFEEDEQKSAAFHQANQPVLLRA